MGRFNFATLHGKYTKVYFWALFTQLFGVSFLLKSFDFFYSERASEAPFGKCPELTPRAFFMWKSKLEPGRNVFQTIPTKEMFPKAEHSPRYKTKDGQHLLPSLVKVKKFVFAIKVPLKISPSVKVSGNFKHFKVVVKPALIFYRTQVRS